MFHLSHSGFIDKRTFSKTRKVCSSAPHCPIHFVLLLLKFYLPNVKIFTSARKFISPLNHILPVEKSGLHSHIIPLVSVLPERLNFILLSGKLFVILILRLHSLFWPRDIALYCIHSQIHIYISTHIHSLQHEPLSFLLIFDLHTTKRFALR
jgi:hypothetical protein